MNSTDIICLKVDFGTTKNSPEEGDLVPSAIYIPVLGLFGMFSITADIATFFILQTLSYKMSGISLKTNVTNI